MNASVSPVITLRSSYAKLTPTFADVPLLLPIHAKAAAGSDELPFLFTKKSVLAELCKNEVAYVSKQKWFIELVENGSADNIIPLLDLLDKRKKIIKGMAKGKAALNGSDFDSNDLNKDEGQNE